MLDFTVFSVFTTNVQYIKISHFLYYFGITLHNLDYFTLQNRVKFRVKLILFLNLHIPYNCPIYASFLTLFLAVNGVILLISTRASSNFK